MSSQDVYDLLLPLLDGCIGHFICEDTATATSFVRSLKSIHTNVTHIRPVAVEFIAEIAHKYDASPEVKANGYRSLLALLDSLLHIIVANLQIIHKEKKNVFFRANRYSEKLRALAQNLHQMRALLGYAQILIGMTESGTLFASEEESDDILHDCEIMAKSCFYSYVQGFQYYAGIQPVIQALSMFTASYNDIAQHNSVWQSTKSLLNSGKYVVSPSVRGENIEKIYSQAGTSFFKALFAIPEMGVGTLLPNLVGDAVRVNRTFNIPPSPFELETVSGDFVDIKRTSMLGTQPLVKARLISGVLREGQDSSNSPSLPIGFDKSKVFLKGTPKPKSKTLLFFLHGGGFISFTTKSYEVVLREWSNALDCPIFSVDYSLAPDAPFPEAFEECFYAYAWGLKNAHFLGTTAERVIFAGDSAGGNLVLSVAMRAATYDIKRPDAMLVMYPASVVRNCASPSRLLSVMDPILPLCMLSACMCAYTGFRTEEIEYNTEDHKLQPTSDVAHSEAECQRPLTPTDSQNSVISTFFQDVGEGLRRLGPGSSRPEPNSENWWDDELTVHESADAAEASPKPSRLTGYFKDFGKKVSSMFSTQSPHVPDTYWNSEFDLVSLDSEDDSPTNEASSLQDHQGSNMANLQPHFKVKLANNFVPLKSRFFGQRMKVHHTALVKNPYISPGLAPDEMLASLPFVDLVGCEFDPLFDDSVTLARRLHEIGHAYKFHVVRGQPHGFLSLQMCKETREASSMCLRLLKEKVVND